MVKEKRSKAEEIAADLRARILSGDLTGELPPLSELMQTFTAANNTVQRAVQMLRREGFVESRQGVASHVRSRLLETIDADVYFDPRNGVYKYPSLEVSLGPPPADVRDGLGLDVGESAVLRKRTMTRHGEIVEMGWSYYPADLAAGTPLAQRRRIPDGGAPRVLAELGHRQAELVDTVSTRPPTVEEADVLGLPPEVWVLRTFRVIYSEAGRPVEVTVMVKGAYLYEVRYRKKLH